MTDRASIANSARTSGETHQQSPLVVVGGGAVLTTNQGIPVTDNQNSLTAGSRGPTLLEHFVLREKIFHFDHERIPERIVHARGSAAHGFFELYEVSPTSRRRTCSNARASARPFSHASRPSRAALALSILRATCEASP